MDWTRVLAYVTGTVDQELQLKARLKLSDVERAMLGEIGHRLGRKALAN